MKRGVIIVLSKVLALIAVVFVSTASGAYLHRPEIPAELK
ncbi:cyclic lactone autoinducer peptide [Cohnella sp.]